ncbi:hypothetical protein ACFL3G_08790, partial [Planctomycetota bacterium]
IVFLLISVVTSSITILHKNNFIISITTFLDKAYFTKTKKPLPAFSPSSKKSLIAAIHIKGDAERHCLT